MSVSALFARCRRRTKKGTDSMPAGLINDAIADVLTREASKVRAPNVIVEIGSFKGMSTCALAAGSGVPVFAIDPWDLEGNESGRFGFAEAGTKETFLKTTAEYPLVQPVQGFSLDIAADWHRPIGLLFIDGDHSEHAVRADWKAWSPHLSDDATVIFDDYVSETGQSLGVRLAVDALELGHRVVVDRLAVVER